MTLKNLYPYENLLIIAKPKKAQICLWCSQMGHVQRDENVFVFFLN